MYSSLTHFVKTLEKEGELIRIKTPVDPCLEITEITDRISKQPGGGKALLFENTGTKFPVLTNLFGSERRMALALGVERIEELSERIEALFAELTAPKIRFTDKLRLLPTLGSMAAWFPKNRKGPGACQAVILKEPNLAQLPILKCWPLDGGRFVTLPMVNTLDPETGIRNVGMYRMQLFPESFEPGKSPTGNNQLNAIRSSSIPRSEDTPNPALEGTSDSSPNPTLEGTSDSSPSAKSCSDWTCRTTAMHWHLHKTGARHYEQYRARGERMPCAVCLGGDPAYTYAATAPLPDNLDEYLLAGFLRRKPVELVECLTVPLRVPCDCDFVLEGYVDPAEEKVIEGPFGDHTGFYSLEDRYPLFHITCITHRKNAIYPATIVGIPPQEDRYIALATERIFLAPIRLVVQPEVCDLYLPHEGVAHNIALVKIRQSYPGQAFKVAQALWGAGQMMFNKFMIITANDTDLHDTGALANALRTREFPRDLLFARGPLDVLDHAAPEPSFGGKLCIDATTSATPRNAQSVDAQTAPGSIQPTGAITGVNSDLLETWGALLINVARNVRTPDALQTTVQKFRTIHSLKSIKYIVVFDPGIDLHDLPTLLWLAGSHADPSRDLFVEAGALVVDARAKYGGINGFQRRFPNVVTSAPETLKLVDQRWNSYGFTEPLESPSRKYRTLLLSDTCAVEVECPPEN